MKHLPHLCILGINGSYGGAVAQAALAKGHRVTALVRDLAKTSKRWQHPNLRLIEGDASRVADVNRATAQADTLVYGVNLPYHHWQAQALALLQISIGVAQTKSLRFVFPENVYSLAPAATPITEAAASAPPTAKGKIRVAMREALKQAANQGLRVLVIRAGDFFGPNSDSSWLTHLVQAKGEGWVLKDPSVSGHRHAWAYLPDLAKATLSLLASESNEELEGFDEYHFAGHALAFSELADALQALSPQPLKQVAFPWWQVKVMAWVSPLFREIMAMRYLWQRDLRLDGSKLQRRLPALKSTPIEQALAVTLGLPNVMPSSTNPAFSSAGSVPLD